MATPLLVPTFVSLEDCERECSNVISYCTPVYNSDGFVCQLNVFVFLLIIFLAIFTGVLVPITCLLCYVLGWCRTVKRIMRKRSGNDDELTKLNGVKVNTIISDSETPVPIVVSTRIRKSEHTITPKRYQKRLRWKSAGSIS